MIYDCGVMNLVSTIFISPPAPRALPFPLTSTAFHAQTKEIKGTCGDTCQLFVILVRENFIGKLRTREGKIILFFNYYL